MSPFDQLTQRITQRLKIDRELRCQVAAELRHHLEDSAAAFRQGGDSQEQAQANAIKALGDEAEVADGLWRANRGRIRLRAAAWWVARLTLLPLAIVLMLGFMGRGLLTSARIQVLRAGGSEVPADLGLVSWLAAREARALRNSLTDDQRLIVFGDESAGDPVAAQRAIWERFPDQPMYYANYLRTLLTHDPALNQGKEPFDVPAIRAALLEVDRGRQIDPNNAIYDVIHAALILKYAVELEEDESLSYEIPLGDGRTSVDHPSRLVIKDQAAFDQAMDAFVRSASKPYVRTYTIEMEMKRQALLPRPQTLQGQLQMTARLATVLWPTLSYQRLPALSAGAHALALARDGRGTEAHALIDAVDALAVKLAANSRSAIEMLVALANHKMALTHRALVFELLGEDEAALTAHERAAALTRQYRELMHKSDPRSSAKDPHAGFMVNLMTPALPGYRPPAAGWRTAEYATLDKAALTLGLLAMNLMTVLMGAASLLWLLRRRRAGDGPMLLWIGWRRLVTILLAAVAAPMAIFTFWTWLSPASSRQFGADVALDRASLEYMLLGAAVFVLLVSFGLRAIRTRAIEIGMATPPAQRARDHRGFAVVGAVILIAVAVFVLTWSPDQRRTGTTLLLHGALVTSTLLWLLRQLCRLSGYSIWRALGYVALPTVLCGGLFYAGARLMNFRDAAGFLVAFTCIGFVGGFFWAFMRALSSQSDRSRFTFSAVRSLVPILALTAVVTTAVAGPTIWRVEAEAVSNIGDAGQFLINEVEKSNLRLVRDWIVGGE